MFTSFFSETEPKDRSIIVRMNTMAIIKSTATHVKEHYWPLIKIRQTVLLSLTGVAGFLSRRTPLLGWSHTLGLIGTLLLTISGCTVINMIFDRDIDQKMSRTSRRPLALGQVKPGKAAWLAIILIVPGLLWSLVLSRLYFVLILAGVVLDVLVYTLWLKRRSAWSIFWGGFSGGMPILAGSALAVGRIDTVGLLLFLAIVSWIPSHNLTLGILYSSDYLNAGVPTFLNVYGPAMTSLSVGLSSLVTAFLMSVVFVILRFPLAELVILAGLSLGLIGVAFYAWVRPSQRVTSSIYKYSSLYMLFVMLLLSIRLL